MGAALKAQSMIELGKVHRLRDDFKHISLHLNEYQERYKSLPGDDYTIGTALPHLDGAIPCGIATPGKCAPGNGIIDGN